MNVPYHPQILEKTGDAASADEMKYSPNKLF